MSPPFLALFALEGLPEFRPGDDLVGLVIDALADNALSLADGDVLVLAQKIVSKTEGRYVDLATVEPSDLAHELAAVCNKAPQLVEVVLRESTGVVRIAPGVLIVRHRLGFVLANAGVDQSNIEGGEGRVLLLPEDPDASAAGIRAAVKERLGVNIAVLINDSFGRPWRLGVCGAGIGCAGVNALVDQRGRMDRAGRSLRVTQVAVADELSAAASLVMGQADEGRPIVLVRGLTNSMLGDTPATALVRALDEDLFR